MKTSVEIRSEIDALQAKLAPLHKQIEELRAASESTEAERSSHAFAALIENDADSKSQMAQLDGKPQQLQADAKNLESVIRVGNESWPIFARNFRRQCSLKKYKRSVFFASRPASPMVGWKNWLHLFLKPLQKPLRLRRNCD